MKKLMITFAFLIMGSSLTGCGATLLGKDSANSTPNLIGLERHFQRIITYDCAHNVISDSIETVKSPTHLVEVAADQPSKVYSSSFKNRRNGASPGVIMGNYKFTIDYSYGFLNMHVEPGINTIDYKFFACDSWGTDPNGQQICKSKSVIEEGSVTLDIRYTEKTLSGYQENTNCPQPSPTPQP